MDALIDVLGALRLATAYYCRADLAAPWGLDFPERDFATFHFVVAGECWLRSVEGPLRLSAGDFVLLPSTQRHQVADGPSSAALPFDKLDHRPTGDRSAILRVEGEGQRCTLVCAGVCFEGAVPHPVLDALPEAIVVSAADRAGASMRPALAALGAEVESGSTGSQAIVTRLAEVLVLQAVRAWIESGQDPQRPWIAGLRDPRIARVLARIHAEAAKPWTLGSLAEEAAMSRTAFAERFTTLVGQSPMHYLARWRMYLASTWLRDERLSQADVADRLGYASVTAFSRAYKKHVGATPGAIRRAARLERSA